MLTRLPILAANWNPLVCCAEDDGGDPAGGGGAPETEDQTAAEGISEEEVQRRVKEATDQAWADARKKYQGATRKQPPARKAGNGEPTTSDLMAKIEEMEQRRTFDRLALRHKVSEEQTDDLFDLFKLQSPEDADGWLKGKMAKFGGAQPQPSDTAGAKPGEQTPAPTPPPEIRLPAGGSPHKVDRNATGGVVDIFELSPDELEAMGSSQLRREFEKLTAMADEKAGAPPLPAVLRNKG